MGKLKKSIAFKFIIGALFFASGVALAVLLLFENYVYKDGLYTDYGIKLCVEDIKMDLVSREADRIIDEYYEDFIAGNEKRINEFKEKYSEEQTNVLYEFEIENNGKIIKINNYELDKGLIDSSNSIKTHICYSENQVFTYEINVEELADYVCNVYSIDDREIRNEITRNIHLYVDNYDNELYFETRFTSYDGEQYLNYPITKLPAYDREIEAFIKSILEKYDDFSTLESNIDINSAIQTYEKVFECVNYINVPVTVKIKNNLTANDAIKASRKIDFLENVMPTLVKISFLLIFIVPIIFLVTFILLCLSAGHYNDDDELRLGLVSKIPYIAFLFAIGAPADAIWHFYGGSFLDVFVLICILGFFGTLALYIVAERLKVGKFLEGFLIVRVYKLLKKYAVLILKKTKIKHSFLAILVVYSLLEILIIANVCSDAVVSMLFLSIVKSVLAFVSIGRLSANIDEMITINKKIANNEYDDATVITEQLTLDENDKMYFLDGYVEDAMLIKDGINTQVGERLKSERMKAELITNVSHDIKTPLTSIINYVDLIKKEDVKEEKVNEYIEVLDRQSQKLKKLITDLIEASKASSGNVNVNITDIDAGVMLEQVVGEYQEKFNSKNLELIQNIKNDNQIVEADGQILWRVFDNLFNNIYKYAMENTRVYIDVEDCDLDDNKQNYMSISIKNISKESLNVTGDELRQRFVRGDVSRNTEGSGLGLSIAEDLLRLLNGRLDIYVDGDFYKAVINVKKSNNVE